MNTVDAKRVLETALICAPQPVTLRELRSLFDDVLGSDTLKDLLLDLQVDILKAMQPVLGRIKPGLPPHIPMLTDSRQVAEQPVQSMRWLVREFVLLRQFLGQDREELEGIWSLG